MVERRYHSVGPLLPGSEPCAEFSPAEISVGAIRFLFGARVSASSFSTSCADVPLCLSLVSSLSDSLIAPRSLLPRTLPLMELLALCDTFVMGVCGGVVNARGGTGPELVAVTDGTELSVGVGLLTTPEFGGAMFVLDCTETDAAELIGLTGPGKIGVLFAKPGVVANVGGCNGGVFVVGVIVGVCWCCLSSE